MMILSFNRSWIHKGNLILVNKQHPITQEYDFMKRELMEVAYSHKSVQLERGTACILRETLQSLEYEQFLHPISGYRSYEEQTRIYYDISEEKGIDYAKRYVAIPNESEHQTGLAFDLGEIRENIRRKYPKLKYRDMTHRFQKQAMKYGFIERYPEGKEHITGIGYEPWHFRFVGYPHSVIMNQYKMTLEEYIKYIKQFPMEGEHLQFICGTCKYEIYYVFAANERVFIPVHECDEVEVSGNNIDGFIVTVRKSNREEYEKC